MKEIITKLLQKELGISKTEIESLIEIPPRNEMGDYSFPCFTLPKLLEKSGFPAPDNNPLKIAESLAKKITKTKSKKVEKVESKGAYVNFFLDKKFLAKEILKNSMNKNFGKHKQKTPKKLVIEFSQPNTHKAFHVGHIRGTAIGESLARIYENDGFTATRLNYHGDTGMHIAKWIWCYQNFHKGEKLTSNEKWIAEIYTEAVKRLSENEDLQEEVNIINQKLEDKSDKTINELWKKTRKLSIASWNKIYQELNTKFDKQYFESEVELEGKKIAQDLVRKKIAKKDDAIFMDLEEYNLGTLVLLRKDATVLYSAKDLALAIKKTKEFPADEYIITIGDEQKHYFKQLQKTLELMKFKKAKEYNVITFGMIRFPEGKMSSRTGNNILYSEFIENVTKAAKEGLISRSEILDDPLTGKKALTIAISAIKYAILKQDPAKNIVFDPKQAISFEGDTGPYLLYSYARANSIAKKVTSKAKSNFDNLESQELKLLKKISEFPHITKRAKENNAPNLIANFSFELSKLFNEFYHACPVLGNSSEGRRLEIIKAFKNTLQKSLDLLAINILDEM